MKSRPQKPRPFEPTTITSAPKFSASSMIACFTPPVKTSVSIETFSAGILVRTTFSASATASFDFFVRRDHLAAFFDGAAAEFRAIGGNQDFHFFYSFYFAEAITIS
jgi:hypothetical protein